MSRIFTFFIAAFSLLACETREIKLQQLLLKGNIALEAGQLEQGAYYYSEALKLDSCFADARNNLGTISFRSGNWDDAIHQYDLALQCKPDARFYLNRANANFEANAFYKSLEDVEQTLHTYPDTIPGLVLRGLVLARLLRYDEAQNQFTAIIQKDSLNPEHWVNRGTISYYKKEFERAIPDLKKALELDSANSEAFNALAMISSEKGFLNDALNYIDRALLFSPDHPHYLNNRGYILIMMNKIPEGEDDINESMVREPNNPWVYRNKGIIYFKLNEFESAERLFRQVLSMDSSVDKALEYLGLTLIAKGKKPEGCTFLRKGRLTALFKSKACS